jgi:hypothetical protein
MRKDLMPKTKPSPDTKPRWLVEFYLVPVPRRGPPDDITKRTEDSMERTRDYVIQMQGESLEHIHKQLGDFFPKSCLAYARHE